MKIISFVVAVLLPFGALCVAGQQRDDRSSFMAELLEPDSLTNLAFKAYSSCPPRYTNTISNPNLFTDSETRMLKEIFLKYRSVSTNTGPAGTVLEKLERTNDYHIGYFRYTNSAAREVIMFGNKPPNTNFTPRHDGSYEAFAGAFAFFGSWAKYRNEDNDGYDVMLSRPSTNGTLTPVWFAQIKQNKVDGLFVAFHDGRCESVLHFANGRAYGEWLEWDAYTDSRLLKIIIKSSLDYFHYMTQKIEM